MHAGALDRQPGLRRERPDERNVTPIESAVIVGLEIDHADDASLT